MENVTLSNELFAGMDKVVGKIAEPYVGSNVQSTNLSCGTWECYTDIYTCCFS